MFRRGKSGKRLAAVVLGVFLFALLHNPVMDEAWAFDPENFTVNSITIGKTYDHDRNLVNTYILIKGTYLEDAEVGVITDATGYQPLANRTTNSFGILQFTISEDMKISSLVIGTGEIAIGEGQDMPSLTGIDRKVKLNEDLHIQGTNLSKLGNLAGNNLEVKINNTVINQSKITVVSNEKANITMDSGQTGMQEIVVTHQETSNLMVQGSIRSNAAINLKYTYQDQFLLVQDLDVSSDLEMFPNRGEKGDSVFFRATKLDDYDVFFLKALDGTDPYSNSNRGKNTVFKGDAEGEMDILSVQVPDINTGEYYVVLTNKIAAGQDPMNSVISEWVVGKDTPEMFTVIDAKNKAKIFNIQPPLGPDSGSSATISGQFLGSINISDLTIYENVTDKTLKSANGESLIREISPAVGEIKVGYYKSTIEIKHISREIKAIIGNKATFRDGWSFTRELDRIPVNVPQVTDAGTDPKKDVVVETTTVLTGNDGKLYTFKERAELKDGYTFIPSMIAPEISGIIPDIIEVTEESGGNYRLPEPRIVALHGANFTIHRFEKEGQIITRYPLIRLGEIELNKNASPDLEIFVLDKDGNILDGSTDHEIGTKIIALIPDDKLISNTSLGKTFVEVVNPVRNSEEMGLSDRAQDMVEFVVVPGSKQPVIEKVSPDVVSVNGGEEIAITGSNFASEVKVFLDGEEISAIRRQEDGKKITFTAPPGREGETQLQVMNPEGGMDTWPFTYVTTYTNPRIINFAPRQGNTGTLVMLTGENFLKPEPTANEDTILRLIGTRVLLEGIEVNDYNRNTATKKLELQDYSPAPGIVNEVLRVADGQLQLAGYYHALLYEDEQGRFYTLDVNSRGDIILSNGAGTEYTIKLGTDPGTIVASKSGGGSYALTVRDVASLQIADTPSLNLQARTVYKTENGIITGCRVKVLGIDTLYFTVPLLEADGYYDVTVVNPDTKQDSKKDQEGFLYYSQPQSKPVITNIEPAEGSIQGGYTVEITGSEFEDNGVTKSRVYVNGAEVPPQDTIVNTLGNNIKIKMPPYPGDLREDKGTDRLAVPVVVVNPDGGSYSCEEGFTYVVPKSHPAITKVVPSKGSAAGGDIVEITGSDFRFYEPYDDANRNQIWDAGESYNDLNKNGSWDIINQSDPLALPVPLDHSTYSVFYSSPVLPKIYFGENLAKIVEFDRGYIKVLSPPGTAGNINVYLVNNDSGISNAVIFAYEGSAPKINVIVPDQGRKQGRESAEITGSGFFNTSVKIWRDDHLISQQMPVVRFGDIDNHEIPRDQPNSGRIDSGRASVELPGGLKVEYNAMGAYASLTISIKENDVLYEASFDEYDDSVRFIDTASLISVSDGITRYPGFELIKVSVKDRRLLVERGYSPEAELLRSTQISVKTPSYYTIGKVPVTVSNPDGGVAVTEFEYKNPDSNPKIINITRDGLDPKEMNVGGRDLRVLQMNYQGNSLVTVLGEDFRENARIMIGDLFTVEANDINYTLPNKLSFTMPDIDENQIGKLHRVVVINEDGGVAASDELPAGQKSIYLQFTKGETAPVGEKAEPIQGPAAGGTVVKITGKDFRTSMEGYEGKSIEVYFGGKKAEKVKLADYKTIYAVTPANIPGKQPIKVENPDGEMAEISKGFTYISNPQIAAVVAASDSTETARVREVSIEGGQEIKIKGSGFMEGIKAVFVPELKQAEAGDKGEQIYRQTSILREFDGQSISSQELAPYILKSGLEATEVKFIDNETITVKVPAGKIDAQGLIVINPDKGASETYDDIKYGLPGLDVPLNVTAEIMHDKYNNTDRFIKVAWNPVKGATEYEVYVFIDGQSKFIGATDLTTYVYTDLKERTTYQFKVTAVGNFGSSKPSSESNKVKTGRKVGVPDEDGSLDEKTAMKRQGDKAIVSIGTEELNKDILVIDLTRGALAGSKDLVVSIPASVITAYDAPDIEVKGSDFGIKFNPRVFQIERVYNNSQDNAGVRFSGIHSRDNLKVPGGNNLSAVLDLKAELFVGQSAETLDYLSGNISLLLDYDAAKAQMRRINNIQLSRYDEYSGAWLPIGNNYNVGGSTSGSINKMGLYTVMGSRR